MHNPAPSRSSKFLPFLGILASMVLGACVVAEPERQSGPQVAAAPPVQSTPAAAPAAPAARAAPAPMGGQQVYNTVCIACHYPPGIGGAPALGDQAAWAPRIAQGMDTLNDHALNGFSGKTGVMPRKGERPDLSDAEVISAVEYMVQQATP